MDKFDAIIIGAGPGGLTTAIYLARFRRRVLVLDGGMPRAAWIPESHNTPGFPAGISGRDLIARLRVQTEEYGGLIRAGHADRLEAALDGFRVFSGEHEATAPYVVLATGVEDVKPPLAGIEAAIQRSVVRVCPICDGFEAIGKRIAVLGDDDLGAREALFLRTYSNDVTLLHLGDCARLTNRAGLAAANVDVVRAHLDAIALNDRDVAVTAPDGAELRYEYLYLALGCDQRSSLPTMEPPERDDDGSLIVDAHQQTSIAGVFAVGDIVRGLNQIAVAAGEAAIAATHIHHCLRECGEAAQRGQGGAPGS